MRKNIKREKERAAGERFISLLNREGGYNFAFKEQPADDPPDLVYEDLGASGTLALEITAAYYNSQHAKWLWDIDREIDTREISPSPLISEPTVSSYTFLNDLIAKKCKDIIQAKGKRPTGFATPIFLVIDIQMFSVTKEKISEFNASHLVLPVEVPFQEIWLLYNEPHTMPFFEASVEGLAKVLDKGTPDHRVRLYPTTEVYS